MSHFYGIVDGRRQKSQATRRGFKDSGLRTIAASWEGAVDVTLWHQDGEDWCEVSLIPWHGNGTTHRIYCGPVKRYAPEN